MKKIIAREGLILLGIVFLGLPLHRANTFYSLGFQDDEGEINRDKQGGRNKI